MRGRVPFIIIGLLLTGCATMPSGPSVMVLPGTGKTFEQFQADDLVCRQWTAQYLGITPGEVSATSTAGGAALGTVVGAAAGAAIGAAAGSPAAGAAVGAGAGLLGGTAVGAGWAEGSSYEVQRRYDMAYMQCMYARGNQIPVSRGSQPAYTAPPPPPPPAAVPPGVPPPPSGTPPSPPPGSR
ncbi:MAG TPA: glycine zipper family protein [Methylomirabilota bacterium]|nr:glycine zipper family protein [Methylomirabilota bacterium]